MFTEFQNFFGAPVWVNLLVLHTPVFIVVLLYWLMMSGRVGAGGIDNLFREDPNTELRDDALPKYNRSAREALAPAPDDPARGKRRYLAPTSISPVFWGGMCGVVLASTGLGVAALRVMAGDIKALPTPVERIQPLDVRIDVLLCLLAAVMLISFLVIYRNIRAAKRAPLRGETFRLFLGVICGGLLSTAAMSLGLLFKELSTDYFTGAIQDLFQQRRTLEHIVTSTPMFALSFILLRLRRALPVVSIFGALTILVLLYFVFRLLTPTYELVVLTAFALYLVISARWRGAYQFPNVLKSGDNGQPLSYYDAPVDLKQHLDRPAAVKAAESGAISPIMALEGWRNRVQGPTDPKPKLALLLTSGGAYRAAFWTTLFLDRLQVDSTPGGPTPNLARDIRVMCGASGGMVGASYFATRPDIDGDASITDMLTADTLLGDAALEHPTPRDSLTPVARQLLQRDLTHLLSFKPQREDRGVMLDRQWCCLNAISFADQLPREARGESPALIFSPMIIDTGEPLFITNLHMDLDSSSVQDMSLNFFEMFPEARPHFKISTATRMNASFPYVSPAVELPTTPPVRIGDAGYFDNYGVSAAMTLLESPPVRDWILENTRGVVVMQLFAFPTRKVVDTPPGALARAFQGVTSPIEGLLAARKSSNVFRNARTMNAMKRLYETEASARFSTDRDFSFDVFSFLNQDDTSLNWYLPEDELESMKRSLDSDDNRQVFQKLQAAWS